MARYEKVDVDHPEESEASDSEFENGSVPRTSTDIRLSDREILEGEEEVERLLSGGGGGDGGGKTLSFKRMFGKGDRERRKQEKQADQGVRREAKRQTRREKHRKQRGGKEEESELMYEMEEGHKDSSDTSSGNSSEVDRVNLGDVRAPKTSRRTRYGKMIAIYGVILLAFAGLLFGAYKASSHKSRTKTLLKTLSNGTSTFAPTTIYISLDGFRADFLHRDITPHMNAFVQAGVSPRYMNPSFPSVTFPNHFTLVTGLYPEAHGVVGNTFWDPVLQEEFYYTDPTRSMQPKWWQGEPLWVTAEDQGVRSAIHMWPGSEAHIGDIEPTYVDKYNGKEPLSNKVDRILGLLDLPGPGEIGATAETPRPQLIAAYVPNVDQHGHLYGPNSTEIRTDISEVDSMLGDLFQGLEERNLTDVVNIVIVSDHGMASTDTSRLIQLDDIIDMDMIEHTDGWPLYGLRPKNESDLVLFYYHLKAEASVFGNFEVYLRDHDMPERYHFSRNERIAPLWMIPKTGWAIVTKDEFGVKEGLKKGNVYHPRGLHGYDHEHPLMRAIFMARGPAFPHTPGSEIEVFQNIEVYNIICDSLGIEPKPNNGTLRLPLKPVGVHEKLPAGEIPDDPPAAPESAATSAPVEVSTTVDESKIYSTEVTDGVPAASDAFSTTDRPASPEVATPLESATPSESTTPPEQTSQPARPVVNDGGKAEEQNFNHWWDWVNGKLDGIKDWATGLVDKVNDKVNNKDSDKDQSGG